MMPVIRVVMMMSVIIRPVIVITIMFSCIATSCYKYCNYKKKYWKGVLLYLFMGDFLTMEF